jgi:L-amino acid N-acyltransferase YncA
MQSADAAQVLAIYREGIEDRVATFETACPDWPQFDANHMNECRLVAAIDGRVVGWGALSQASERTCYRGVAEVSIYVARNQRGRKIGSAIMAALVAESERCGFWTLQGTTFEENEPSRKLQEKFEFRLVGRRERIAMLGGIWKSTILMERRSRRVGGGLK